MCLSLILLGFVLFLYGANFYDAIVGWLGVFVILGGALALLLLYIYCELKKQGSVQKP
jgi:hypothetical protein